MVIIKSQDIFIEWNLFSMNPLVVYFSEYMHGAWHVASTYRTRDSDCWNDKWWPTLVHTEIWTLVWNIGSLAFAMTCNSPIHQRLGSQALLLLRCQGLSYVEFFAGEGEVFRAIRADHHPGAAVDIEYMVGSGHAMDINSDSGLPFHPLQLYSQSYFSKCIVQWVINKMMFDFESSVLHEHVEFHLAF